MSCLWRPHLLLVALLSLTPGVICDASYKLAQRQMNQTATVGKAVYLINNEQTNAVVALRVGPDGKLSPGTVTPTGGAGSVALNSKGEPAITDALVSQSALTVAGNVGAKPNAVLPGLSYQRCCSLYGVSSASSPSTPAPIH